MANNISKKTEQFNKRREERNLAQKVILSLDTIADDDYVQGIVEGMKTFESITKSNNTGTGAVSEAAQKRTRKMLNTSREQLEKAVNGGEKETQPIEKNFENFYGPIIAQSMAVHSQWLLGKSNGLLDYRNVSKALSTEAQGIISIALGTVLQINTGDADVVDTGWVELFEITDALLGTSSVKILNLSNYIRVQELREGTKIEARQSISTADMEQTVYKRYGIAMLYSTFEQELTTFFNTANGVNRIFRDFRSSMAFTKSTVAYRTITKKPGQAYIMDAVDVADAPLPTNSTYDERVSYKVHRFIANLSKAYLNFKAQMKLDGLRVGVRPTVHVLYNPDALGAGMIDQVLTRLNDSTRPIAMRANLVFHESSDVPLCGAWEETIEGGKVVKDEDGFDVPKEAASEDSFGVMLVLPKGGNIHGINNNLYNISQEYPENESIGYFTFERYTFHASKFQRYWLRNLVPASEAVTMPLDNGE